MVYSAWRILFSVINEMVNGNSKSTYEKQWNLLRDMFVLCKPHVLEEEGFPIIHAKSFSGSSQKGIYIFSLNDLEIERPYITKGDTLLVRVSTKEVQMGELNSNTSSSPNGIVTLQIPTKEELKPSFYCPTISGILMGEIMVLALEQFTKKKLQKGMFFYEFVSGDLQFGRCIKNLEELSPNTTYVSEDYSVKIKRKSGGRFSFFFAGYNIHTSCNNIKSPIMMPMEIPNEEPFPIHLTNITTKNEEKILKNETEDNILLEDNIDNNNINNNNNDLNFQPVINDEEINQMINEIEGDLPKPPPIHILPPPMNIPPPPPLLNNKKICDTPNKKKMRPLRWSTIPRHQLQSTIWGQEKSPVNSLISVKEKDLERLFSISPINSPAKQSIGSKVVKKKKSLLPLKRANNISIVLSRLPPVDDLIKRILNESNETLSIDQLNSLNSILPITEEDITTINNYKGDYNNLSKAEQFIYKCSKINRIQEKINCLQFMYLLKEYYSDIVPQIQIVSLACKEVQESKSLKKLLKLILQVGSILNRDTYLSGKGFRLQSLTTISQTKAKCGNVTLLHYLGQLIINNEPELLHFELNELPNCSTASKIPIEAIISQVKEVTQHLQTIENELKAIQNDKENSLQIHEKFAITLLNFYKEAKVQVESMQRATSNLKIIFTKVGAYFGEDPSDISTNDFFSVIHQFSDNLLKTQLDNKATKLMEKMVDTPSPKKPVDLPVSTTIDNI